MNDLGLTKEDREILTSILRGPFEVLVFGSRTKGTHKPFSDIDICLKGAQALPRSLLADLRGQLEECDLPYKVDLIDYHQVSDGFRTLIDRTAMQVGKEGF
ncbi:MAG: nucleotidyltransferase domain-containing protein [Deltaproteobacteria bacterium]|nr:nucleotidyltransferase domain-containing protein [Deltaproteobacteria bacterium]